MDNLRKLELLEELALLKRRQRAVNDFEYFIDTYLGHLRTSTTPQFHKDIIRLLNTAIIKDNKEEGEQTPRGGEQNNTITLPQFSPKNTKPLDKKNRMLFIAPRGFAKSTICSVFFPMWLALNKHKTDIFLVS